MNVCGVDAVSQRHEKMKGMTRATFHVMRGGSNFYYRTRAGGYCHACLIHLADSALSRHHIAPPHRGRHIFFRKDMYRGFILRHVP